MDVQQEVKNNVVKPLVPTANQVLAVDLYSLIGLVAGTLRLAGLYDREEEFIHQTMPLGTFDQVLQLSKSYVQFEGEKQHDGI